MRFSDINITRTLPGNMRYLTEDEEREIIALEGVRTPKFLSFEFNLPIQRILGIWERQR